jgi:predicted exporter
MAEIGGGMERDLSGPALGTLALIAALFYAVHRRWRPLLWLVALLLVNFFMTLGLGGWLLGAINVVNLGFAAILLGLAADYAIVLLQEARAHPELTAEDVQKRGRAGIYWSAATTAGAFLLLRFSGLPGLGQLGLLVAAGIVLAAGLMTAFYLAPLRGKGELPAQPVASGGAMARWLALEPRWRRWAVVVLATGCAATLGALGMPALERATIALRPKHSQAYAVWEEFKQTTSAGEEPLLLLVRAGSASELYAAAQELRRQGQVLSRAGVVDRFHLPVELAPDAPWRMTNAGSLRTVAARKEALIQAALEAGFTTNALGLTLGVLEHWQQAGGGGVPAMPAAARWLRERCYAAEGGQRVLLGLVQPVHSPAPVVEQLRWPAALPGEVYLTNWEWMGNRLARMVLDELPWLLAAMGVVVALSLWLAFRAWREVALSLAALGFSLLLLLAWMRLAGWRWNLMNLMALPLVFGLGVDYCLHLLLGLRRHAGDWRATHEAVGRALLLAGGTTAAAFASLTFSSNAGVASLGQTTAAGVLASLIVALFFLPAWECRSRR